MGIKTIFGVILLLISLFMVYGLYDTWNMADYGHSWKILFLTNIFGYGSIGCYLLKKSKL